MIVNDNMGLLRLIAKVLNKNNQYLYSDVIGMSLGDFIKLTMED